MWYLSALLLGSALIADAEFATPTAAGTVSAYKNANNEDYNRYEADSNQSDNPEPVSFAYVWLIKPRILHCIIQLVTETNWTWKYVWTWTCIGDYYKFRADWGFKRRAHDCSRVVFYECCGVASVRAIVDVYNWIAKGLQPQLNIGRCVVSVFIVLGTNNPVTCFVRGGDPFFNYNFVRDLQSVLRGRRQGGRCRVANSWGHANPESPVQGLSLLFESWSICANNIFCAILAVCRSASRRTTPSEAFRKFAVWIRRSIVRIAKCVSYLLKTLRYGCRDSIVELLGKRCHQKDR